MTNLFFNLANKNLSTKIWPYEFNFQKNFLKCCLHYHLTLYQDNHFIIWKRMKNIDKPERLSYSYQSQKLQVEELLKR